MSHTNTTTNYGLPQFLSSDKPAWMADINVAFADIDSQMKLNADAAADAQSDVNDASLNFAAGYSNASTYDVGDVVVYNNRMYICDVAVTVPESFDLAKWTYYRVSNTADAVENVTSAENALETLVGSTDISAIGDGTVTGAIDTINTNLSELIDDNYTFVSDNSNITAVVNNVIRVGDCLVCDIELSASVTISHSEAIGHLATSDGTRITMQSRSTFFAHSVGGSVAYLGISASGDIRFASTSGMNPTYYGFQFIAKITS